MPDPSTYQFNLPSAGRPTNEVLSQHWYPGIQRYWEGASAKRTVDPILGIRAVVIHATAGSSSEGAISVIKSTTASFHWLVPDENEPPHGQFIWACIPEARRAWHVRKQCHHPAVNGDATNVNDWALGIEVVNAQAGNDPFSAWQLEVTASIVRYCWAKYPNLRHVVSHARLDPTRRSDPGPNFDWPHFQQSVLQGNGEPLPREIALATPASRIRASAGAGGCCSG